MIKRKVGECVECKKELFEYTGKLGHGIEISNRTSYLDLFDNGIVCHKCYDRKKHIASLNNKKYYYKREVRTWLNN